MTFIREYSTWRGYSTNIARTIRGRKSSDTLGISTISASSCAPTSCSSRTSKQTALFVKPAAHSAWISSRRKTVRKVLPSTPMKIQRSAKRTTARSPTTTSIVLPGARLKSPSSSVSELPSPRSKKKRSKRKFFFCSSPFCSPL